MGPSELLVFLGGRLQHDLEIGDRERALADRRADAVGAGIAAADHHHMLVGREDRLDAVLRLVVDAPVLLRAEVRSEWDGFEIPTGDRQVACFFGASCQHDGVVVGNEFGGSEIAADMDATMETHALGLHLRDTAGNKMLLHLEIRDAVTQQSARLRELFINMDIMAGARELLGAGKARRTRPHHRDSLAGLARWRLGLNPALLESAIHDGAFDGLDGNGIVSNVERARSFARGWTDATGELGKVVGRMQVARRFLPCARVDEVIPVGDLVVDRASGVTIRDAATHAARRLLPGVGFGQWEDELAPVANALLDRLIVPVVAFEFEEPRNFTHSPQTPPPPF